MLSARTARWIAWLIVAAYFLLAGVGFALQVATGRTFFHFDVPLLLAISVIVAVWVVVGAIIVARHPRHPVGWIVSLALTAWGPDSFTYGYVVYGASLPASGLPGINAALLWQTWTGFPFAMFALGLLFLLFPNGRPPSPGWGTLKWSLLAGLIGYLAVAPLRPGSLTADAALSSPLAAAERWGPMLDAALGAASLVLVASLLAAAISLVLRLRHAAPIERQQVKWFVYAAALVPLPAILLAVEVDTGLTGGRLSDLAVTGHIISLAGVAIATALSIFRYRLFDIDRIINRTLVYGWLTATLLLIYFAGVVVFQSAVSALTGQRSPIAIVGSTLLVAAAFQPLRGRLQQLIDRRFFRRRYDAAELVAEFGAGLREAVDSDDLTRILLGAVDDALQPSTASLWLKQTAVGPPSRPRG